MSATKFALDIRSCMAIVSAEFISSSMRAVSSVDALERDLQSQAAARAHARCGSFPLGSNDDDRLGTGAPALRHADPAAGRVTGTGACPLAAWPFAAPRWLWDSVP